MNFPGLIGGAGRLAGWLNHLRNACRAAALKQVIGGRLLPATDGQTLVIDFPAPGAPGPHPFQIVMAPPGATGAAVWRTARVRLGKCFVDWTEATVTGTDDADPDLDDFSTTTTADIEIPASDPEHWIWLEVSGGSASIEHAATAPTWSSTVIPIGYVDTDTYSASNRARVRQLLRTDVFTCT
jgi:hypothetical protein